jgi:hypothetical protein
MDRVSVATENLGEQVGAKLTPLLAKGMSSLPFVRFENRNRDEHPDGPAGVPQSRQGHELRFQRGRPSDHPVGDPCGHPDPRRLKDTLSGLVRFISACSPAVGARRGTP